MDTAGKARLLRVREVLGRTGLHRSHLYRLMREGRFPRGVKLGVRAVAWVESDVDAWLASRIASR